MNKMEFEGCKYVCLIMTESYIEKHFSDIKLYSNIIEKRIPDSEISKEELIIDNNYNLDMCKKYNYGYPLLNPHQNKLFLFYQDLII